MKNLLHYWNSPIEQFKCALTSRNFDSSIQFNIDISHLGLENPTYITNIITAFRLPTFFLSDCFKLNCQTLAGCTELTARLLNKLTDSLP